MNAVSEEQQQIINNIQNNKNVIVDACAGSGKSTTILSTAKSMPHKRFLLITYNKSLRKTNLFLIMSRITDIFVI